MNARVLTVAAVLAAAMPAARADHTLPSEQVPVKARDLAEEGRRQHQAGNYGAAIEAFKEAYVLAPSPSLLFNIAQAYRLAGDCDEAAWMYRRYLDTNPRGLEHDLARQHLATVERCGTGGLRITVPPPVDAPISSNPGATGAMLGARVATPSHTPAVRAAATHEHDVDDHRGHRLKRVGIYSAIGGGVLLIGAAVFAAEAADASSAVSRGYTSGGKWSDLSDADATGKRDAAIATTLGIGGGLAVVSGAVLYGLGRHYEHARYVAINPTKHGAQVSLSWGF